MVEVEFINSVVRTRCTGGGIQIHWPPPETQSLNGIAERGVGILKNAGNALLQHASLPKKFWRYACTHATFILNRCVVNDTTGKTPYEVLQKQLPSIKHWGVFGCDVLRFIPKKERGAFGSHSAPGIYLGHDEQRLGAHIYDMKREK